MKPTFWNQTKLFFLNSLNWYKKLQNFRRIAYSSFIQFSVTSLKPYVAKFKQRKGTTFESINMAITKLCRFSIQESFTYVVRSGIGALTNVWAAIFVNPFLLLFRKLFAGKARPTSETQQQQEKMQPIDKSLQSGLLTLWTRLTGFVWAQGLYFIDLLKRTWGEGFVYFKGVIIVFVADALIVDDEPLWEPVEWSMAQAWILIIFLLAWIAENLIVSRYGSYTGRDKRVWFAWYKTFWLVDLGFVLSLGAAIIFVMIPFYYELNYLMTFTTSWWNWYTRVFFFKFLAFNLIVLLGTLFLQIKIRTLHWKSAFILVLIVNLFFSYLLYTHFFLSFFSYFTHVNWYNSTRLIDYVQLSHEPNKWSWGAKKRDHFSYHKSSTVFWFKNDGPFAAASLLIQFLFFITLFLTFFYWLILLRRIYATQEFSFTYTVYAISALKQFFFFFFLLYLFVLGSYLIAYWRFPIEFTWVTNPSSWFSNLIDIFLDYPNLILSIFGKN